jgi:hypothetical protein
MSGPKLITCPRNVRQRPDLPQHRLGPAQAGADDLEVHFGVPHAHAGRAEHDREPFGTIADQVDAVAHARQGLPVRPAGQVHGHRRAHPGTAVHGAGGRLDKVTDRNVTEPHLRDPGDTDRLVLAPLFRQPRV